MGCNVRDKHIRTARRARSVKSEHDPCCYFDKAHIPKSLLESGLKHLGINDPNQNLNPNTPNCSFDDHGWGYCTEEQLEEILLRNLDFLYNEAVSKLVGLGYDEDVALKAILKNGHCYGGMDVLTNILHNSLAYLNSSVNSCNVNSDESEPVFTVLRQLEEYSLAGMVCLLQQVRPHLSKGDALWCLLMSELHVGRASSIEIPGTNGCSSTVSNNIESVLNNNGVNGVMAPALCRFHGGWGFGNGGNSECTVNGLFSYSGDMNLTRDIDCPKRFNLTPHMKSLLKRNVAMFAAGFRANSKQMMHSPSQPLAVDAGSTAPRSDIVVKKCEETKNLKEDLDGVDLVMGKLSAKNIKETLQSATAKQKDQMIDTLAKQIEDLEKQVLERRSWAHQKAMQAATKLSNDLTELKMLRMEREETQKLKKGKQTLEDTTMKRLSEMESALRKASGQVDRANAAVRRLENENAELRAEMEASKLSASESVTSCLESAKREKKCLKRLLAWEKQRIKWQEQIADQKKKVKELQQCLARIQQDQKETESKWRQEQKAKECALSQVDEERRSKETAEASNKRKLESLRLKVEIDFQRHKDDLQRLEEEFTRLKGLKESADPNHQSSDDSSSEKSDNEAKVQQETITRLLEKLALLDDCSEKETESNRECLICMEDEVSVVFLPCAHQVLCANCSEDYGKKGKSTCPCCRVPIEQKVHVFGATSS